MPEQTTPPDAANEAPARMTLGRVIELLTARGTTSSSSVELTRNAKGETQIAVIVRADDSGAIATPDEAYAKAIELYDAARVRYPLSTGHVGATPAD
jgi:predicted aconitase with swiveling domain